MSGLAVFEMVQRKTRMAMAVFVLSQLKHSKRVATASAKTQANAIVKPLDSVGVLRKEGRLKEA